MIQRERNGEVTWDGVAIAIGERIERNNRDKLFPEISRIEERIEPLETMARAWENEMQSRLKAEKRRDKIGIGILLMVGGEFGRMVTDLITNFLKHHF